MHGHCRHEKQRRPTRLANGMTNRVSVLFGNTTHTCQPDFFTAFQSFPTTFSKKREKI